MNSKYHLHQLHDFIPMIGLCLGLAFSPLSYGANTSPQQLLQRWSAEAGKTANVNNGNVFFNTRHGSEWACASCHGTPPTQQGKHASTAKLIDPLAPAFNPKTFTDTARVDKWLRRNCKDVLDRECTSAEKADILAYLISLKP